MRNISSDDSNSLYKSAITGAYFSIFNTVTAFLPLTYKVSAFKGLFILYLISGFLMLSLNLIIIFSYRKNYNYNFSSLRFLYFTGFLSFAFYSGLYFKLLLIFGISFLNFLIVILLYSLNVMAAFDIIKSSHLGMIRMKTLYLRTIGNQYFKNALTIFLGIVVGVALIAPFFLYIWIEVYYGD